MLFMNPNWLEENKKLIGQIELGTFHWYPPYPFKLEKKETCRVFVNIESKLVVKYDEEKSQNTREWGVYNAIPDSSPYKEYFPKLHYLSSNSKFLVSEFIVHRVNHETQWEKLKKEIKDNGFLNYCTYLIGMDPYELRKFDSWRFDVVDGKQKFKLVDFGN
jgi:hypothetical protein